MHIFNQIGSPPLNIFSKKLPSPPIDISNYLWLNVLCMLITPEIIHSLIGYLLRYLKRMQCLAQWRWWGMDIYVPHWRDPETSHVCDGPPWYLQPQHQAHKLHLFHTKMSHACHAEHRDIVKRLITNRVVSENRFFKRAMFRSLYQSAPFWVFVNIFPFQANMSLIFMCIPDVLLKFHKRVKTKQELIF